MGDQVAAGAHASRHLDWPDCFNIRDLGGLPTVDGRETCRGAVLRGDSVGRLTADGWSALWDHGVRTVLDLRNPGETTYDRPGRHRGVETVQVPLDDEDDEEFWHHIRSNQLDGSPLLYPHVLDRKATRCAAVVTAIARAGPGGVLFHCAAGRDRTGLITLLLLSLAGVEPDHIVADYELSTARLEPAWPVFGMPDQGNQIAENLKSRGTTARTLLLDLLEDFNAHDYLTAAGVAETDLSQLTTRMLAKSPM